MPDGEAALRETRRVLRSGGRVALAAWAEPDANPWTVLAPRELVKRGRMEPPDPDAPGQFAWSRSETIAERLEDTGFVDYEIEPLDFTFRYPSVQAWWETQRDLSLRFGEATAGLDPEITADIQAALAESVAPWTGEDGSLAIPARTWVAVAIA
jgi:SAM-dependent methyltransferase